MHVPVMIQNNDDDDDDDDNNNNNNNNNNNHHQKKNERRGGGFGNLCPETSGGPTIKYCKPSLQKTSLHTAMQNPRRNVFFLRVRL